MELDYINRCEQDLLQAVQDAESAVTQLRRFAASFLLMQSRQSTPGTNATTIASVENTEEGWLLISLPVMLPAGEKRTEHDFWTNLCGQPSAVIVRTSLCRNSKPACWSTSKYTMLPILADASPTMTIWN